MPDRIVRFSARLIPIVAGAAESLRVAFANAGMNLTQTIIVFSVEAGRQCWRRMPWRF